MSSPSAETYTSSQLLAIFTLIDLPPHLYEPYITSAGSLRLPHNDPSQSSHLLIFLTHLQQHTLSSIPFENLSLHYSPHHTINLDPQNLYKKLITDGKGRGGYCMENNAFFGTVLRGLGFDCYAVGARVNGSADGGVEGYGGWSHMVNIVVLGGGHQDNGAKDGSRAGGETKYMLDVGFGANGPIIPMRLVAGEESDNLPPSRSRLVRESVPGQRSTRDEHRHWIYQHRTGVGTGTARGAGVAAEEGTGPAIDDDPDGGWKNMYCFIDQEFLAQDYKIMNFWTSQSRTVFFTYAIVVVKFLMDGGELVGKVILNGGIVKRRVGGETEVLKECEKEEDRVQALERWFGIVLERDEREGIGGLVTELKG